MTNTDVCDVTVASGGVRVAKVKTFNNSAVFLMKAQNNRHIVDVFTK